MFSEYLTCRDVGRAERIDGIVYVRAPPAPSRTHREFLGELHLQRRLASDAKARHAGMAPFDGRLPRCAGARGQIDTVVQPDVLIASEPTRPDERGMRGAPDGLAQVLSPATAGHDPIVKLPVYASAGVLAVGFVHPGEPIVSIYRFLGGRNGLPTVLELKGRAAISANPGVALDWDRVPGGTEWLFDLRQRAETRLLHCLLVRRPASPEAGQPVLLPRLDEAGGLTDREGPIATRASWGLSRVNLFLFGRREGIN